MLAVIVVAVEAIDKCVSGHASKPVDGPDMLSAFKLFVVADVDGIGIDVDTNARSGALGASTPSLPPCKM